MKTALCHSLGIEYPIIAAPMGRYRRLSRRLAELIVSA